MKYFYFILFFVYNIFVKCSIEELQNLCTFPVNLENLPETFEQGKASVTLNNENFTVKKIADFDLALREINALELIKSKDLEKSVMKYFGCFVNEENVYLFYEDFQSYLKLSTEIEILREYGETSTLEHFGFDLKFMEIINDLLLFLIKTDEFNVNKDNVYINQGIILIDYQFDVHKNNLMNLAEIISLMFCNVNSNEIVCKPKEVVNFIKFIYENADLSVTTLAQTLEYLNLKSSSKFLINENENDKKLKNICQRMSNYKAKVTFISKIDKKANSYVERVTYKAQYFAAKTILILNEDSRELAYREVRNLLLMKGASHVLNFEDCFYSEDQLIIITELCQTDLFNDLKSHWNDSKKEIYPQSLLKKISSQILIGLKELHEKNLIHFDIKPENIFYSQNNKWIIGDLNISMTFEEIQQLPKEYFKGRGTFGYRSPELVLDESNSKLDVSKVDDFKKLDLWSFGILLQMLTHNFNPVMDYAEGFTEKGNMLEILKKQSFQGFILSTSTLFIDKKRFIEPRWVKNLLSKTLTEFELRSFDAQQLLEELNALRIVPVSMSGNNVRNQSKGVSGKETHERNRSLCEKSDVKQNPLTNQRRQLNPRSKAEKPESKQMKPASQEEKTVKQASREATPPTKKVANEPSPPTKEVSPPSRNVTPPNKQAPVRRHIPQSKSGPIQQSNLAESKSIRRSNSPPTTKKLTKSRGSTGKVEERQRFRL